MSTTLTSRNPSVKTDDPLFSAEGTRVRNSLEDVKRGEKQRNEQYDEAKAEEISKHGSKIPEDKVQDEEIGKPKEHMPVEEPVPALSQLRLIILMLGLGLSLFLVALDFVRGPICTSNRRIECPDNSNPTDHR
jgi:hypothetical protein